MREKFLNLVKSKEYENEEYIIDIISTLNGSKEARIAFNDVFQLKERDFITAIFMKMDKSIDKLLQSSDYKKIKDFIKLYTKTKYNDEINMCFSKKITRKTKCNDRVKEALIEHDLITKMEEKMGAKLIEYSRIDYNGCMKFVEEIPEFFVSENQYGNNYYMRRDVLPAIMGVKHVFDNNKNSFLKVDLECKTSLSEIIRYLKRKKTQFASVEEKNLNVRKDDERDFYEL